MANLNLPCPDCGRIGVCVCDARVTEQRELAALRATIAEQAATIARLEGGRDGWERTAADMANGMAFYRDIVRQAGQHFGPAVYTSDDGSVQDEVLALKVPELAAAVVAERDALKDALEVARQIVASAAVTMPRLYTALDDIDAALNRPDAKDDKGAEHPPYCLGDCCITTKNGKLYYRDGSPVP